MEASRSSFPFSLSGAETPNVFRRSGSEEECFQGRLYNLGVSGLSFSHLLVAGQSHMSDPTTIILSLRPLPTALSSLRPKKAPDTLGMDKKTELSDRHSINKASPDLPQELPAEHTNSPRSTNAHAFAALPSLRKNLLYTVLTSALAINYISNSSLFTTIETIAASIHLSEGGNAIWMISAYAMAFAACIPLAGRLSDVFRPQWCFLSGLAGICALTLGNSFGKYGSMRTDGIYVKG
jgi:hypothetical protein